MLSTFRIKNLTCWACSASIAPELIKLRGVYSTSVNVIDGIIEVNHTDEVKREQISLKLKELGYTEIPDDK
ncbi:MAG: heavy-metal-associated domain-containing protein [Bacteroidales bacterium]